MRSLKPAQSLSKTAGWVRRSAGPLQVMVAPQLMKEKIMENENIVENAEQCWRVTDRRSFLLKGAAVGAGAIGASRLLADPAPASADAGPTPGDVAILQFLAAAELLEADLWDQYNELAGIQDPEVPGGS